MSEYVKIDVTEAVSGDEVFQGGEWVAIESVHKLQHSDSVKIIWAGGGSHCAPRHHFMARRLVVDAAEQGDAELCGSYAQHGLISGACPDCGFDMLASFPAEQHEQQTHIDADCASFADGDELVDLGIEWPTCGECAEAAEQLVRSEREAVIDDVRSVYGSEAAELVRNGWTVDSAIAHVSGDCDRELCTGEHNDAAIIARATGSSAATVTIERRTLSGELVVESVESFERDVEHCAECGVRPAGHGHFAQYCEPCSVLPYGVAAPVEHVHNGCGLDCTRGEHDADDIELAAKHDESVETYERPKPSCEHEHVGPDFDGTTIGFPCGGVGAYVVIFELRTPRCAEDEQTQQMLLCADHTSELDDDDDVRVLRVLAVQIGG